MSLRFEIQDLFSEASRRNASDIHISVNVPPIFRVDEQLRRIDHPPLSVEDVKMILSRLISDLQFKRFYSEKELDFSFNFPLGNGETIRFRGNCFFERGNIAIVLRLIPQEIRLIKNLLLPSQIQEVAKKRRGLFLVTGPSGHGKSTSLAAIIQEINLTRNCHIVTIEDPIEYMFTSVKSLIQQREREEDAASFAEALKRTLRQDPDVIMIGEMRDLDTTRAAITAAETGHLVLSTLHTPDSSQSIDRILDIFPAYQQDQVKLQLANILIGVCSQQLIPLLEGGRIVATELMWAVPAVCNCIRERKIHGIKNIIQTGLDQGMHTMDQDLIRLVKEGKLPKDLAASYALERKEFNRMLYL